MKRRLNSPNLSKEVIAKVEIHIGINRPAKYFVEIAKGIQPIGFAVDDSPFRDISTFENATVGEYIDLIGLLSVEPVVVFVHEVESAFVDEAVFMDTVLSTHVVVHLEDMVVGGDEVFGRGKVFRVEEVVHERLAGMDSLAGEIFLKSSIGDSGPKTRPR